MPGRHQRARRWLVGSLVLPGKAPPDALLEIHNRRWNGLPPEQEAVAWLTDRERIPARPFFRRRLRVRRAFATPIHWSGGAFAGAQPCDVNFQHAPGNHASRRIPTTSPRRTGRLRLSLSRINGQVSIESENPCPLREVNCRSSIAGQSAFDGLSQHVHSRTQLVRSGDSRLT